MNELTKKDWRIIVDALNSRIAYAQRELGNLRNLPIRTTNSAIRANIKEQVDYWKSEIKKCLDVKMKIEDDRY